MNPKSPKQTFDQFCKSELFEESQLIKEGYIEKTHTYATKSKSFSRKFEGNERNFKPFNDEKKKLT